MHRCLGENMDVVDYYEMLNDEITHLAAQGNYKEIDQVSQRSINLLRVMNSFELDRCLERIYKVR